MPDLTFLSAVSMAAQIRHKKLSPVELVEAHLARIEKLNPKLNAFVEVDAEGARRQARAAEQAVTRNESMGPLHGVPISIKSSLEVKGMRCEAGTRLRPAYFRLLARFAWHLQRAGGNPLATRPTCAGSADRVVAYAGFEVELHRRVRST